jgi:hypothetical protein
VRVRGGLPYLELSAVVELATVSFNQGSIISSRQHLIWRIRDNETHSLMRGHGDSLLDNIDHVVWRTVRILVVKNNWLILDVDELVIRRSHHTSTTVLNLYHRMLRSLHQVASACESSPTNILLLLLRRALLLRRCWVESRQQR